MPHAEVDLRVGGRYCITMHTPDGDITAMVGGTYHEVHPPEKLVFSWAWEAPQPDSSETLVTVELHDVKGETEIIITHESFPSQTGPEEHTIGWNCALERFILLVEERRRWQILDTHGDPCRVVRDEGSHFFVLRSALRAMGGQASYRLTFRWTASGIIL